MKTVYYLLLASLATFHLNGMDMEKTGSLSPDLAKKRKTTKPTQNPDGIEYIKLTPVKKLHNGHNIK